MHIYIYRGRHDWSQDIPPTSRNLKYLALASKGITGDVRSLKMMKPLGDGGCVRSENAWVLVRYFNGGLMVTQWD